MIETRLTNQDTYKKIKPSITAAALSQLPEMDIGSIFSIQPYAFIERKFNSIGQPDDYDFGVSTCPPQDLPPFLKPMKGCYEKYHKNYGNYWSDIHRMQYVYIAKHYVRKEMVDGKEVLLYSDTPKTGYVLEPCFGIGGPKAVNGIFVEKWLMTFSTVDKRQVGDRHAPPLFWAHKKPSGVLRVYSEGNVWDGLTADLPGHVYNQASLTIVGLNQYLAAHTQRYTQGIDPYSVGTKYQPWTVSVMSMLKRLYYARMWCGTKKNRCMKTRYAVGDMAKLPYIFGDRISYFEGMQYGGILSLGRLTPFSFEAKAFYDSISHPHRIWDVGVNDIDSIESIITHNGNPAGVVMPCGFNTYLDGAWFDGDPTRLKLKLNNSTTTLTGAATMMVCPWLSTTTSGLYGIDTKGGEGFEFWPFSTDTTSPDFYKFMIGMPKVLLSNVADPTFYPSDKKGRSYTTAELESLPKAVSKFGYPVFDLRINSTITSGYNFYAGCGINYDLDAFGLRIFAQNEASQPEVPFATVIRNAIWHK